MQKKYIGYLFLAALLLTGIILVIIAATTNIRSDDPDRSKKEEEVKLLNTIGIALIIVSCFTIGGILS